MSEILHYTVPFGAEGTRADKLLGSAFPEYSRSYLKKLIDDGCMTANGKVIRGSRKLKAGEVVDISLPPLEEAEILPEEMPLSILYEDEDVLIVDKPQGLTVHPAPGHPDGTLVNGIMAHCGESLSGIGGVARPGIVHRIDKDTSGALIICKNDRAHRSIAAQLKDHSITRLYRGIVSGNIKEDELRLEGAIGRNPKDRKKMAIVPEGGKEAVTHCRVLERFGQYTYCEFRLETGRTHQIRVHMAANGHPLLGDPLYGSGRNPFGLMGQALHAMVIGFIHPTSGTYMEFTAPLPEYFAKLLKTLGG